MRAAPQARRCVAALSHATSHRSSCSGHVSAAVVTGYFARRRASAVASSPSTSPAVEALPQQPQQQAPTTGMFSLRRMLSVLCVDASGRLAEMRMPVSQLRDESRLHVRELLLLEQPAALVQARVLPRRHCIVVTVGYVRALIFPERVYLFGPTAPHVAGYAAALAAHVAGGARLSPIGTDDAAEPPFEFVVVEHALMTLVARQGKRVTYARRVLESLLARLGGGPGAADDARTLALFPLAQTLSHYEMVSRGICDSVRLLLDDDRDMREMCLTAKSRASLAVVAAAAARARDEAAAYDPPPTGVAAIQDDSAPFGLDHGGDGGTLMANGVAAASPRLRRDGHGGDRGIGVGDASAAGPLSSAAAGGGGGSEGSDAYLGYATSPIASHRHLGRVLAGDSAQAPGGAAARAAAASDASAAARRVWSGVDPERGGDGGGRGGGASASSRRRPPPHAPAPHHGDGAPSAAATVAAHRVAAPFAAVDNAGAAGPQLDLTSRWPGASASDITGAPPGGVGAMRAAAASRHALPAPFYMGSAAAAGSGSSGLGSLGFRGSDDAVRLPPSAYAPATPDPSRFSRSGDASDSLSPPPPPALLLRIAPDVLSQLELMLEGVFHSASETVVGLVELSRSLRSKLDIVELQQSTLRNELLGLSLRISALGVSLSAATFITSAFGMNLPSGLEGGPPSAPTLFLAVSAVSAIVGASTFRAFSALTQRGSPAAAHARRLAAFQGFLLRLDSNVDAARSTLSRAAVGAQQQQLAAAAAAAAAAASGGGGGVWRSAGGSSTAAVAGGSTLLTKAQFKELHEATSGRKLDDEETTLLFELFDADADGRIRLDEALDSLESTNGGGTAGALGQSAAKLRW